jgi:hypothetical protein
MLTRTISALALCTSIAHADRTTAVQVDALGLLDGRYAISLDHEITPNAAISVELSDVPGGPATRGLTVALPVFASHVFRGFFVSPGVSVRGTWSSDNTLAPDVSTELAAQIVLGWAWLTGSGLAISAAVGAVDELALTGYYCDCVAGVQPTGYVRIGYAF